MGCFSAKIQHQNIKISGIDPLATFKLLIPNWRTCITFFIQEMLKRIFGFR